ncbi:hypothetical protein ABBQ32_000230 [Trebouxia sp. C0010 RCD-2024]
MPLGCFATHSQDWKLLALSDTQVSCRCLIAFNKLSPGKRPSNLISAACSADQCLNRLRICWTQSRLPQASRAMLVIAHPDDETMFFTPTIQALIQQGCSVVILCLSIGDHSGLGRVRRKELLAACCTLGIEHRHIVIVDHPKLQVCEVELQYTGSSTCLLLASCQDGPQCWWPSELVASIIAKEAEKRNIEMVRYCASIRRHSRQDVRHRQYSSC